MTSAVGLAGIGHSTHDRRVGPAARPGNTRKAGAPLLHNAGHPTDTGARPEAHPSGHRHPRPARRRIRRRARSRVPDQARPDGGRHRVGAGPAAVSARVGGGPVQQLAVLDNEAVDVFETPDIDHDGYADLAIGQSGGGTQARMRLFLYRPNEGTTRRSAIPRPRPAPATASSIPYSTPASPPSTGCRYSADSQAQESYAVRPDGTAVPVSWITQIWFPQASAKVEARYEFHGDGTVARICWTAKARRSTAATTWRPSTTSISMTRPTSRTAHRRSCARRAV